MVTQVLVCITLCIRASSNSQSDGGGSTLSTAKDVGGLLERVYRRTAVSEEASAQMWNLLWNQQRRIKIPAGLPSGVISGNKTGETDSYQHDAAIVYGEKTDYVIVVFSQYWGILWYQRNTAYLQSCIQLSE